jgi:predicted nucleotidyltransferase
MAKTKNQINKLEFQAIKYLKEYFDVRQIILFGSQLTGKANKFSDIDLAVISPDFDKKSFEDLVSIFAKITLLCDNAIEIHPYSLDALKEARPSNFLGYILKKGKVIYKS